jgi:hypothetical protein
MFIVAVVSMLVHRYSMLGVGAFFKKKVEDLSVPAGDTVEPV